MPFFFISFSMISCSWRDGGHDRKNSKKLLVRRAEERRVGDQKVEDARGVGVEGVGGGGQHGREGEGLQGGQAVVRRGEGELAVVVQVRAQLLQLRLAATAIDARHAAGCEKGQY